MSLCPVGFHRTRSSDPVTGLLDRTGCLKTTMDLLDNGTACGEGKLTALWLDLDRFKQVNESLGHLGGDAVIGAIADRLRTLIDGRAELCRMGGDEFVCLIPGCDHVRSHQFARELMVAVEEPLRLGGLTLHPTMSVGIAVHERGEDPLALLERADRAMYAAKHQGGQRIVTAEGHDVPGIVGVALAREELLIENHLHTALESGGLQLHYQPIIAADGRIEAVEALMRCVIAGKPISPAKFIPVAEKTGLIIRLGAWSLLQGSIDARRLMEAGLHTKVAINVSRAQLVSPSFANALQTALTCADIPAGMIELELTESLFLDISQTVQSNLRTACKIGVGLAIDDFGTGYSCLANLKDIPASKLKLDRAFVTALPENRRALSIVKAVAQLGRDLGMITVAEGAERKAQIDVLLETGVEAIQGDFYAGPMPAETLLSWIRNRSTL